MSEHSGDKGKSSGRARLIQAAQELAEQRPFDEITIDEIIKRAELSRPAFYYHFAGGKEELRAELAHQFGLAATPGVRHIDISDLAASGLVHFHAVFLDPGQVPKSSFAAQSLDQHFARAVG